jgi:hypothetical protein
MNNRHVLIVGGTRGIGHSLAKVFARDSIVSVIGRCLPKPTENDMPNINYWATDLSDTGHLKKTLKTIISKNGNLSSLIFFQRYRGQGDLWEGEIGVSLTATKNIIEYLTDKFDDAADKAIVIASSMASSYIVREQPVGYHVAKAGLNQMARFFAVNLASREIRVNCVIYGAVLKEESRDFYLKHRKLHSLYKNITPLGRMAVPQDIANAVQFLCSGKASFITGQNLVIDGGISLIGQESLLIKKSN